MKHFLKLVLILTAIFFSGLIFENLIDELKVSISQLDEYVEFFSDFFPVFISFSIFALTWYAYSRSKDIHSLFLGTSFLVIGVIDMAHMLSYPFLPNFITPNSFLKAGALYNEARLFSAILFLGSAYIYKDTLPKFFNKYVLFASAMVLIFISIVPVFFFLNQISVASLDNGFSISTISRQFITTLIIMYACYVYTQRLKETGEKHLSFLVDGFIILIVSDLVYFNYKLPGNFLQLAGFIGIHLALYKSSIELPYDKLAEAEDKLLLATELKNSNKLLQFGIQERKKAEEELRISEEKYRSLVESSDDSIYMVDRHCNYLFINPKHMSRLGIGDYRGRNYSDCHLSAKTDIFMESVNRIFEKGKSLQNEHESNGKWFLRTMSPVRDLETKAIIAVTVVSTDITARKKAEEIHDENERLAIANKAKSEFIANMSHELRTPLNSIIGFTELMKQKTAGELNQKQERYVENVLTSSNFLLNLINDILDLSKVEAGKIELVLERISVPEVIDQTINLLKEKASKNNVLLRKDFDPELDFINADKQRVKQILFNLLSNALKFSKKEGGTITITTRKEGDMAKISVSDTGIGIKEEDIGKLFKEFEQVNAEITKKYGGTGLGLAITKKLVELHGGKIMVESEYGRRTTFTFLLPIIEKKQQT